MEEKSITKEEISTLPLIEYQGEILLVNKQKAVLSAIEDLLTQKVIGFDTETRPAFKKGEHYLPSLLQLATENRVYIFQVQLLEDLNALFSKILENSQLKKVGVAIRDDIKGLKKLCAFKEAGFIEISQLSDQKGYLNNGLRGLAALILGGRISKTEQTSNWANKKLTRKQLLYAATDAWISREIYLKIS